MPGRYSGVRKSSREGNILEIRGLIKTSLIDYPGEICATLFTAGCNLRCPFCHNRDLVLDPGNQPLFPETEVLEFLTRRSRQLGGICISGGEPTLQEGLPDFAARVKSIGLKVKLDTNGTRPNVLRDLLSRGLLDYVAVDIKAPRAKYDYLTGVAMDYQDVLETIALLRENPVEHEFRTTFVPGLLQAADIIAIVRELAGCCHYVLQKFQSSVTLLDPTLNDTRVPYPAKMEELARRCREYVDLVELRGY